MRVIIVRIENLLSFNVNYKQTLMDTALSTAATYLQENPEFKSSIRQYDESNHLELKKLHEENTALLLALRISQREVEIHKKSASKWRTQCEKLLLENRPIVNQAIEKGVRKVREHQKAWERDFDFSSSDEEEE